MATLTAAADTVWGGYSLAERDRRWQAVRDGGKPIVQSADGRQHFVWGGTVVVTDRGAAPLFQRPRGLVAITWAGRLGGAAQAAAVNGGPPAQRAAGSARPRAAARPAPEEPVSHEAEKRPGGARRPHPPKMATWGYDTPGIGETVRATGCGGGLSRTAEATCLVSRSGTPSAQSRSDGKANASSQHLVSCHR